MNMKRHELARHLRMTAVRLRTGASYRWTHQGRCNCGHLAQTLTGLSGPKIHQIALRSEGEWVDHIAEYCETSGLPVNDLIRSMLSFGLLIDELADLERLASSKVTRWLPNGRRYLDYRSREDVILYFETWADVIYAEHRWYINPNEVTLIHGRVFEMYESRTEIPMALDENPASGYVA
jgi:hypothetical protein